MTIEQYRQQWLRYYKGYERYAYNEFRRAFKVWNESIPFDEINENNYEVILSNFEDLEPMNDAMYNVYDNVGYKSGKRTGQGVNKQIREKFFNINVWDSQWKKAVDLFFLQNGLKDVKLLQSTYNDYLIKLFADKFASGKTLYEVIEEMQKVVKQRNFYRWQTERIARTETTKSANYGSVVSGQVTGYVMEKVWVSAQDPRTRGYNFSDKTDHYNMNGIKVGLYESFYLEQNGIAGIARMDYPGDTQYNANASNIANCRCNIAVVPKRDSNGDLIPTASMDGTYV